MAGMLAHQPSLSSEKLPASADLSELQAMNAISCSEGPRVRNQDKVSTRIQDKHPILETLDPSPSC